MSVHVQLVIRISLYVATR